MIRKDFIWAREGGMLLKGYVPHDPNGYSGVTIAAGVDLGHLSRAEFNSLPDDLQAKTIRYFGLRGTAAKVTLKNHPLTVTSDEADILMDLKYLPMSAALRKEFNAASSLDFDHIPDGPATALMSLTWQYGDPWKDPKCGDTFALACAGDWLGMADYLYDGFPDKRFISRRRLEAEFVRQYASTYDGADQDALA